MPIQPLLILNNGEHDSSSQPTCMHAMRWRVVFVLLLSLLLLLLLLLQGVCPNELVLSRREEVGEVGNSTCPRVCVPYFTRCQCPVSCSSYARLPGSRRVAAAVLRRSWWGCGSGSDKDGFMRHA